MERAGELSLERFDTNPLVTPEEGDIGANVNGPSVIRAPRWVDEPLARYYMYFAHHRGSYIRLATADDLRGPWTVHSPGTLHIDDTRFDGHIASPDVHVDPESERIRLYFHGCCGQFQHAGGTSSQTTDVATSNDGLDFAVRGETLGTAYFRVWRYEGAYYALANDGHLYRGTDPLAPFERKQELFPRNRHFAVRFRSTDTLEVWLTRRGDRPERLQVATIDLDRHVDEWRPDPHPPETVLWPEKRYEGGTLPLSTSTGGAADEPERALRDPAIYEEDARTTVFYAVAGESGIAGAEVR